MIQGFIQCDWKDPRAPAPGGYRARPLHGQRRVDVGAVGGRRSGDARSPATISTRFAPHSTAGLARFPASRETFTAFRVQAAAPQPQAALCRGAALWPRRITLGLAGGQHPGDGPGAAHQVLAAGQDGSEMDPLTRLRDGAGRAAIPAQGAKAGGGGGAAAGDDGAIGRGAPPPRAAGRRRTKDRRSQAGGGAVSSLKPTR